jgi:hypothetical protein
MDEALLRERGFHPTSHVIASVDNYGLRIGSRATLVPEPGQRSYGTGMALSDRELGALQGVSSVAGFRPIYYSPYPEKCCHPGMVNTLPEDRLSAQNGAFPGSPSEVAGKTGHPGGSIRHLESMAQNA